MRDCHIKAKAAAAETFYLQKFLEFLLGDDDNVFDRMGKERVARIKKEVSAWFVRLLFVQF